MSSILELFKGLVVEHGGFVITKERLLLMQDKIAVLEARLREAEQENVQLKRELAEYRQKLNGLVVPDEFREYYGALYKKDDEGNFVPVAYCPRCKKPMHNTEPRIFPYACSACGFEIMIHEDLASIAQKLGRKYGNG